MLAALVNLTIEQGSKYSQLIQWNDEAGNSVDLTGYTAKFQVRASKEDTTAIISLTESAGITLGGAAGTIAISIDCDDTAVLDFVKAYYELRLKPPTPANSCIRLMEGFVFLSKGVVQ